MVGIRLQVTTAGDTEPPFWALESHWGLTREIISLCSKQKAEAGRLCEKWGGLLKMPSSGGAAENILSKPGRALRSGSSHFSILEDPSPCYRLESIPAQECLPMYQQSLAFSLWFLSRPCINHFIFQSKKSKYGQEINLKKICHFWWLNAIKDIWS